MKLYTVNSLLYNNYYASILNYVCMCWPGLQLMHIFIHAWSYSHASYYQHGILHIMRSFSWLYTALYIQLWILYMLSKLIVSIKHIVHQQRHKYSFNMPVIAQMRIVANFHGWRLNHGHANTHLSRVKILLFELEPYTVYGCMRVKIQYLWSTYTHKVCSEVHSICTEPNSISLCNCETDTITKTLSNSHVSKTISSMYYALQYYFTLSLLTTQWS